MIIPYAHESHRGRRWPVVTLGLIVVNIACLIAFSASMQAAAQRAEHLAENVLDFRDAHPAVRDTCQPLARASRRHGRARTGLPTIVRGEDLVRDQAEYDALCSELEESLRDSPAAQWGYVPARSGALALVTYQFVHGGWLHLLSNLWFLWLCGCNVEDRWGRGVYLPFYLSAGVVAALAQKVAAPDSLVPIVGASGAIAGAMGAFLVLFARTRIRFAYVFFLVRWGTFTAPAYVMLPLWLATEILWGMAGGSGVAHWAHVGGFVYGAAFAFVLVRSGLDAKLDSAVEDAHTTRLDPRIERAGHLVDAGSVRDAIALLREVAIAQPKSIDAQLELLRAGRTAGDQEVERRAFVRLVELYLETGAWQPAGDLVGELISLGLHTAIPRGWFLNVAAALAAHGADERSNAAYEAAAREGFVDVIAVRAAVAHAKVLARLRRVVQARDLLVAARESPFSTAEIDAVIDADLARLS